MKKKIEIIICLFFLKFNCLSAQAVVKLDGYLIVEKKVYDDSFRGDIFISDELDFKIFFFFESQLNFLKLKNIIKNSFEVFCMYKTNNCNEFQTIGELKFNNYGIDFLKDNEKKYTNDIIIQTNKIFIDEIKNLNLLSDNLKGRTYYILYKVKADVISGNQLIKKYNRANKKEMMRTKSNNIFFYYKGGFDVLDYLVTFIK